jgi:hypothetical protein
MRHDLEVGACTSKMAQETLPNGGTSGSDTAVLVGRALGVVIVGLAVVVGLNMALVLNDLGQLDAQWWVPLSAASTPLGVGFLILVVSEILNRIVRR